MSQKIPFRRRNFFVKQGFQIRFALYPIIFLTLFLVGAGLYLETYLRETFQFQLYLPHSQLQNPWDEVSPALVRVATWGGAAFLLALLVWGWRRFVPLRRDMDRLADWMEGVASGRCSTTLRLRDREVDELARGLARAAATFEEWDGAVRSRAVYLGEVVDAAAVPGGGAEALQGFSRVRTALAELRDTLGEVRIDEGLS